VETLVLDDTMAQRLDKLEQTHALLADAYETMYDVPVTAAAAGNRGDLIGRMNAIGGRAQASPSAQTSPGRRPSSLATPVTLTAAVSSRDVIAGTPLTSAADLASVMSEALQALRPTGSTERRARTVAMARWDYPEERKLTSPDPYENSRKIEQVCGLTAARYDRRTGALVASGGICLPTNVDWSIPVFSTPDRPLRDGLPGFQADRGGLQFVTPPDIGVADLQGTPSGAGTSVAVWTEATDANPAGATKPVWTVACGTPVQVYVNAIPTRVQFGNMSARFAPEQVAADTEQAIAISAREAELELLTTLYASTKQVKPQQYLGATRDLLASVDLLREQYIYSHRVGRNASFCAIFPAWARGVMRADLVREAAHDNAGSVNVLAVDDAQIDDWFRVRGINVIWTLDGLKAGTYGTGGSAITNQFFGLLGSSAPEPQWPGQTSDGAFMLAWLLFPEGTFQFLDGGRLDLGVVRDSTLDAQNNYETFVETFEGAAFRGVEAYQVQSTILPSGGSGATQASASSPPTYHE
jgi:hypothetical protein